MTLISQKQHVAVGLVKSWALDSSADSISDVGWVETRSGSELTQTKNQAQEHLSWHVAQRACECSSLVALHEEEKGFRVLVFDCSNEEKNRSGQWALALVMARGDGSDKEDAR